MERLINEILGIYEKADVVGVAYNLNKELSAYFIHDYEYIPASYKVCVLDKSVFESYEEIEFALYQVLS